ncbi:MAG TPA: YafY family protein [Chitinophagaceae bacterium]|jgi:predicted DNA-binding transcriptional regulator YafY|nr:YafY family protein [Chitinophagaceae bacterium]
MNRIDRLAAILIQLQSRRLVKAQDIAEKFSISLRTVYRDVRALEEAGVPVIGEAGTGYKLMEGYKLPPVMFNQDEASALLTAAKLVQSKTDASISKHYESALDKIKAVLRLTEKDHIEEIEEHVMVMGHPAIVYRPPAELHLQSILKAIGTSSVIEIKYFSIEKNETTQRKVEPVGVYYMGSHWYLVAFCQLRNDYRNFRTDKIDTLTLTDETISKTHPPLQSFINQTSAERQVVEVVIDVESDVVKYLGEQKYYNGFVKQENLGDHVRVHFLTGSLTGFARWYMLFGDHAKIVKPAELNAYVAGIAENILKKIEQTQELLT